MNNYGLLPLIGLTGFLLTACGGGGGGGSSTPVGGGNGGGGTPAPAEIAITATNAPEVAGSVAEAAFSAGELSAGNTFGGVVIATDATAFSLVDVAVAQIERIQSSQLSAFGDGVTGVVIPAEDVACDVDGFARVSGEIADPTGTGLSPGDEFNIVFNECDDGEGIVLSGRFDMVFGNIQGDLLFGGAPYSFSANVDVADFTVTGFGESFSADGDILLEVSSQDDITETIQISGNSLAVTEGGEVSTLTNYDISETMNSQTLAYASDLNGTFSNVSLGGTVSFSTVTLFEGTGFDYPESGEMRIVGANDSAVNLVAEGSGMVALLLDANGDGTVEETIFSTWMEITDL